MVRWARKTNRRLTDGISVYIVRCSDGSLYTGRTTNVERRITEHNLGIGSQYTITRRPVQLLNSWKFETERDAYWVERQIKGWTRRKKEALIAGDFNLLVELSRKKFHKTTASSHHPSMVSSDEPLRVNPFGGES